MLSETFIASEKEILLSILLLFVKSKSFRFQDYSFFLTFGLFTKHFTHSASPINRQHAKSPLPTATPAYYHPPHHSDPYQASSEEKGLINKNVQSTSFKLLQRALEHEDIMEGNDDHDNSHVMPKINTAPSQVKAPRIKDAANDDHDNKGS